MQTLSMNRSTRPGLLHTVALASAMLMAGCAVGPDYVRPTLAASNGFSPKPLPEATASAPVPAGEAQRFDATRDIQADWWTLFGSKPLDAVVRKAFAANPTIESAQAALRVAQENVRAQRGFFFPSVQASYSPARTKIAGNLGGNSPGVQGNGTVISTTAPRTAAPRPSTHR